MINISLNYSNIILNGLLAGFIAVIIAETTLWFLGRAFNYDYIFNFETGRNFLNLDEMTASDRKASVIGLISHFLIGIFAALLYTLVIVPGLALLRVGPYIYDTPDTTAVGQNIIWFFVFAILLWIFWIIILDESSGFDFMLLVYYITFGLAGGITYGLYIFGSPGIIT
ncbi:MAG: hypothetical protein ACXAC7_07745 [Candidatus Hodarchaeales archaeon]|jgi:hypothetical protein